VGKASLLALEYFICNSLNPLLINPRKLSLGYKQIAWRLWVYNCEKNLLGCPTAQALALTQSVNLWLSPSSDPDQDPVVLKILGSHFQCRLSGVAAPQQALMRAACQGLAPPEVALPRSLPVPRPPGIAGLRQILIP